MDVIGLTPCNVCGLTGIQGEEEPCESCQGTGLLPVLECGKIISGIERRRWPRYYFDLHARAVKEMADGKRSAAANARGTAINEGGMAMSADIELEVGDTVEIEFTPPSAGLVVRVRGVIRHASEHYYGVQFIAGSGDEQRELTLLRDSLRHATGHLGPPSY
jgi:PilZ domain